MKELPRYFIAIALLLSLTVFSGCSSRTNRSPVPSISQTARELQAAPVNCETAKQDIAALEAERASVGRQIVAGARSVLPVAAVVGILSGDYSDRVAVATGRYNRDLNAKIAEIRTNCGLDEN